MNKIWNAQDYAKILKKKLKHSSIKTLERNLIFANDDDDQKHLTKIITKFLDFERNHTLKY